MLAVLLTLALARPDDPAAPLAVLADPDRGIASKRQALRDLNDPKYAAHAKAIARALRPHLLADDPESADLALTALKHYAAPAAELPAEALTNPRLPVTRARSRDVATALVGLGPDAAAGVPALTAEAFPQGVKGGALRYRPEVVGTLVALTADADTLHAVAAALAADYRKSHADYLTGLTRRGEIVDNLRFPDRWGRLGALVAAVKRADKPVGRPVPAAALLPVVAAWADVTDNQNNWAKDMVLSPRELELRAHLPAATLGSPTALETLADQVARLGRPADAIPVFRRLLRPTARTLDTDQRTLISRVAEESIAELKKRDKKE